MTFQQLNYVIEISKCGSINKAAHKLFHSQSGISSAVYELEEELNIKLFVRTNRGVEFTPEGKEFLGYATSLLKQKEQIESLYGISNKSSEHTRFSVSTQRYPFTEEAFLMMLQDPEDTCMRYYIKEESMQAVIDDVYDLRADVGVIFLTELTDKIINRLLIARNLDFHEIATVPPCVYVRKGHPLTRLSEINEDDLNDYPYVSFDHDQGVATDFSEEYQILSLKKSSKFISVNNRTTMMNVLSCTDAFTTGSGLLVKEVSPSSVITLPLEGKSGIRLGWIAPTNGNLSFQAQRFISLLEKSVAEAIAYTEQLQKIVESPT